MGVGMYLMWHDSYSVGFAPIDDQHQTLFAISNDLVDAAQRPDGASEAELQKIIGDLLAYTRTHFAQEEQYMSRTGFPGFSQHKDLHQAFEAKIREVEKQVGDGEVRAVAAYLPGLVGDWLLDHIASEDQQYAIHARSAQNSAQG